MKTKYLFSVVSFLLLFVGCTDLSMTVKDKERALEYYNTCEKLAVNWFNQLDSSNYSNLLSVKFPDSYDKNSVYQKTLTVIDYAQKVYGKVKSRKFLASHIWSDEKLLTYAPDLENKILLRIHENRAADGFYMVKPKYFGLSYSGQIFAGFPKGEYVMLLYKSNPTIKSYAEERLIYWKNPQGIWQVIDYKIADDI